MNIVDEFELLQPFKLDSYQRQACEIIVEQNNGILTSMPTGCGKTVVAEFAIWLANRSGNRAIFTNPLKALSTEKLDEWHDKYPDWKVVRDTSDDGHKRSKEYYRDYTVLVTTNERLESILRKRKWINIIFPRVSFVIYDEVHLLGSKGRGSSVEATIIAITLMKKHNILGDVKFVGLSATLPNSGKFGEWWQVPVLLVPPEDRPVPLYHHYEFPTYETTTARRTDDKVNQVFDLMEQYPDQNFLIFVSSRKRCTKIGWDIANSVKSMPRPAWKYLGEHDALLSDMFKRGVAWHNAGLSEEQRKLVEDRFRNGKIKILVATTTLAQGINLPARRVIIFDLARWDGMLSRSDMLEHYEIQQQAGRAGRRSFDTQGDAHYLGTQAELQVAMDSVNNPYDMISVLSEKLDDKILALYVSEVAKSRDDVLDIINGSFGATQGVVNSESIIDTINFLNDNGFTREYANNKIYPTRIGELTSARYLLPRSVIAVHNSFDNLVDKHDTINHANGFHLRDVLVSALKVPEILNGIYYDEGMDHALVHAVIDYLYGNDDSNFEIIKLVHYSDNMEVMMDNTMQLYKLIGIAYGTFFKNQGVRHYTLGSENKARFLIIQWLDNARMISSLYEKTKGIRTIVFSKLVNSIKNGRPFKMVEKEIPIEEISNLDDMFDRIISDQ